MSSTNLAAVPEGAANRLVFDLGADGYVTDVGLVITNPDLSFDRWVEYGRACGEIHRLPGFLIGDWLLFGEALYGEDYAQAVEPTREDRYDVVHRVTGLSPETLSNYASVCRNVRHDRRRAELTFSHHDEVRKLEPDDQVRWLQLAIDEGLSARELRQRIKDALAGDPPAPGFDGGPERVPRGRQLEDAADLVLTAAQKGPDGAYEVPAEPLHVLAAARGRDLEGGE